MNEYEYAFRNELRVRWFDRFLWGLSNGVDQEARYVRAAMPLALAELNDLTKPWGHRFDELLPPPDLQAERVYLTDAGTLAPGAPTGAWTATTISHQVTPGYTPAVWGSSPPMRSLAVIEANIPASKRVFELAPLAIERELGGRIPVSLSITPDAARFQINAQLSARIPLAAQDFAICAKSIGTLDATPGVSMRLEFDLPSAVCVLPPGTVLKLTVRNHWIDEDPMPASATTVSVPYFSSCDALIAHGAGTDASYVDLPFLRGVRLALTSSEVSVPVSAPMATAFTIEGGCARASDVYVIAISAAGQAPGVITGGGRFP